MKNNKMIRAVAGAGLCSAGLWLALSVPTVPIHFVSTPVDAAW
jgi:hypothetical protein